MMMKLSAAGLPAHSLHGRQGVPHKIKPLETGRGELVAGLRPAYPFRDKLGEKWVELVNLVKALGSADQDLFFRLGN